MSPTYPRGRELYFASEKLAEAYFQVTIRFLPGIMPSHRIVHDGPNCCGGDVEIYDIIDIDDVESKHQELVFICRQGLTEG